MLDLNQVRIFVQVVRARSFAEASRRLQVPANTLSRQVRQLEVALDSRLMQRSTRKLTLTTAGAAFFERCAHAVDDVLAAGDATVGDSRAPSGTVRVAAPADFLDLFKIEWVAEFLQRHPRVKLDFVLSDARVDLIAEAIDVTFRGRFTADAMPAYRRLSVQSFRLVASPVYLQQFGMPANLADLSSHRCVTGSSRERSVSWTLTGPDGTHSVEVSGGFAANSSRVQLKACLAGFGIGLLPSMIIAAELQAQRLQLVMPQYRREGGDFCVIVPSRRQIPAAVALFVDFATERFESLAMDI